MSNPAINKIRPFVIVLRRIGPPGIEVLRPMMFVRLWMGRKSLWNEADFKERSDTCGFARIEDLVDDGPVINWFSRRIASEMHWLNPISIRAYRHLRSANCVFGHV